MAMSTKATPDLERRAERALPQRVSSSLERIDRTLATFMEEYGILLLRLAVAVVFIWFGALKVADKSPVADLVSETVYWLPSEFFVRFLGVWEIVVGIGLLIPVALRLTLLLFWAQMLGTFLVLLVHPDRSFDGNPLLLTLTGEFVVKNLVLIAAGLVIGSTVRRRDERIRRPDEREV